MTPSLPTLEDIIAAWYALEDEAETTPTLMQKVCDQFGNLIAPADVAGAVQAQILRERTSTQ